jgi:hypothetical protein
MEGRANVHRARVSDMSVKVDLMDRHDFSGLKARGGEGRMTTPIGDAI